MTTPIVMARWLAERVYVLAGLELVGECFTQIEHLVADIERTINRPESQRYCGNCPTPLDDHQRRLLRHSGEEDRETCSTPLYAKKPDDVQVECWKCHHTHNIEKIIQEAIARRHELLYTEREILEIMAEIGKPIPDRTWRYWRASGKLINRSEWTAEPAYWLEDCINLWVESKRRRSA